MLWLFFAWLSLLGNIQKIFCEKCLVSLLKCMHPMCFYKAMTSFKGKLHNRLFWQFVDPRFPPFSTEAGNYLYEALSFSFPIFFFFYWKIDPSKSKVTIPREAVRDINVVLITIQVNMLQDCLLYSSHPGGDLKTLHLPPSLPPSCPSLAPTPRQEKSVNFKAIFSWTILKSSGPSPRHSSQSTLNHRLVQQGDSLTIKSLLKADSNLGQPKVHSERIL